MAIPCGRVGFVGAVTGIAEVHTASRIPLANTDHALVGLIHDFAPSHYLLDKGVAPAQTARNLLAPHQNIHWDRRDAPGDSEGRTRRFLDGITTMTSTSESSVGHRMRKPNTDALRLNSWAISSQ